MKVKYIMWCTLGLALAACEDYTEHNFGSREDLYQPTQVNVHEVTLVASDYATIANNADNIKFALAANDDSLTYRELKAVAEKQMFFGNITPQEYLPAILSNLVGSSAFYTMTAGSSIIIKYNQEVPGESLNEDAYVPASGPISSGKYLIVPQGYEQVLSNSGEGKTYGYIYLSGSTTTPTAVTRINDAAIKMDDASNAYLYDIQKDADAWLLQNGLGQYLYMAGTYNSFNYMEDLGDLEDEQYPWWNITYNGDGTYDIQNTGTSKIMLLGTAYSSVGAYPDKKGTDGYLGLQLYKKGHISIETKDVEIQDVVFTLSEEGEWEAKGDYLNQTLMDMSSTDAQVIFDTYGWSIENVGGIGDLSYVWNATTSYGMKASAYKSGAYYPVDAWCISPTINLKKAKNPVFYFDQAQKYAGTPLSDFLQVWVSTDYAGQGGQATATWENVTDKVQGEWPDGSSWDFASMSLDLSSYAGGQVNVAFRYISTEEIAATWEFKNVRCAEPDEE